jgi:hypothetical protein
MYDKNMTLFTENVQTTVGSKSLPVFAFLSEKKSHKQTKTGTFSTPQVFA